MSEKAQAGLVTEKRQEPPPEDYVCPHPSLERVEVGHWVVLPALENHAKRNPAAVAEILEFALSKAEAVQDD